MLALLRLSTGSCSPWPQKVPRLQTSSRGKPVRDRVLAMLNFRSRPIYLSDDEIAMDPRFHRCAIAARRMPEFREVRCNFLGRALHTSPEQWQAQVTSILSKA
jgi:hypothetical protein